MAASLFFKHQRLMLILPRQKGGKTELGIRLLHDFTRRDKNMSSLFLAKDKKSAKRATREKFMRVFDKKEFIVNTEQVTLRKNSASTVYIESVDKDPDRIRGGTNGVIHWSEVAFSKIEHGHTIIDVFDRVFQPTLGETNGYAILESTNNGKNGWYDLWENHKQFGFARLKLGLSDYVYFGLITKEEYDEIQKRHHPITFQQEYECDFVSFQGRVYNEFREEVHVARCDPPESWRMVISAIDWGYKPSATCVLFGYVKNGILNIFAEHYQTEELAVHTADAILAIKEKYGINKLACVADHEEDRIQELNLRGIACGKASKANVLGARVQIKERLYFNRIRIDPSCTFLRKDLSIISWDAKKDKDGEVDYNECTYGHFDAEAAFRYLERELSDFEDESPIINPHMDSASEAAFEIMRQRHE